MKKLIPILIILLGCNSKTDKMYSIDNSIFDKFYTDFENEIQSWDNKNDIYAISIWIDSDDDDSRKIQAIVGYNTIEQVNNIKSDASSELEAKWNFAFWIQNEKLVLSCNQPDFQKWIQAQPDYFKDELWNNDFHLALEKSEKLEKVFVEQIIQIVTDLFEKKVIEDNFGMNIPIIIHELEYYDKPIGWTKKANPDGVTEEFEKWIKEF